MSVRKEKKHEERKGEYQSEKLIQKKWVCKERQEKKKVAWWEFRYSVFLVGNGESPHSRILIRIENSGYILHTFACLLLLTETQNCSQ